MIEVLVAIGGLNLPNKLAFASATAVIAAGMAVLVIRPAVSGLIVSGSNASPAASSSQT
jgi:hypothetical protein